MKEELEEREKKQKIVRVAVNLIVVVWNISTIIEGVIITQTHPWVGALFIALSGIFLFCNAMYMYHDGACDTWKKIRDIIDRTSEGGKNE